MQKIENDNNTCTCIYIQLLHVYSFTYIGELKTVFDSQAKSLGEWVIELLISLTTSFRENVITQ